MEEDSVTVINLFDVKRSQSRKREIRTPATDSKNASLRLIKRPISGSFKSSNALVKIELSHQSFRRRSNIRSTTFQPKVQINTPLNLDLLKVEMISTSSTFTPQTLKNVIGVTAESFCVMSKQTKKIICEHNMSQKRQIASLTKMMTAYTVVSLSKQFNIDLFHTIVHVQKQAAQLQGTTADLRLGDQLSIIDLLHGMMLPSGNDAAVALAQYFGKLILSTINIEINNIKTDHSIKQFQQKRICLETKNSKDALRLFMLKLNHIATNQLKLKQSYFANPTGLQHYKSYSNAYDVAIIASQCSQNKILQQVCSKKIYQCQIQNKKLCSYRTVSWRNTNSLLWKRKECVGLKTGYTPWAGACLTSIFNLKGQNLIVVVLKSSSKEQRFSDTDKLYLWYKRR